MTEKWRIYNPRLKLHHILFISMILSPLLILNSSIINIKKKQSKNISRDEIYNLDTRKLHTSDFDEFNSDRNKICQKGTKSLKEYYFTNEGSKIGIALDDPIKKDKKYIDDIINKVSNEGYSNEVLKQYIKHLIPVLFFLIISLLFLPGWLICCFCGCFKCCCCNCCKKNNYKIPFYTMTVVLYALAICISIYGLIQSNSIFMGFADIECSILNFLNEIIEGETKSVNPKWIGLHNLDNKFNESKIQINKILSWWYNEYKETAKL